MAKYLYITTQYVQMSVQLELDFNRWYWEEHLLAVTAIPGVLSAQRYHIASAAYPEAAQYMAIYELESPEVVEGYAWQICLEGSEWRKRLSLHFQATPGVYERFYPQDADDSAPYPVADSLYVVRMTPTAAGEQEFNDWYSQIHVPEVVDVPGVLNGRRYVRAGRQYPYAPKYLALYELESPAVAESAAWRAAAYNPRANDVLRRTRLLRSLGGVYQRMRRPE